MAKKNTGYQYTVTIDQAAAERANLPDSIDDRHLAIVDMATKYLAWEGAKTMEYAGRRYFLLDWQMVLQRLPRFPLKSRSRIKDAIALLIEVGIFDAHPDNVRLRQSWVTFGKTYSHLSNFEPSQIWDASPKNGHTVPNLGLQPSQIWDGDRPKSGTDTVPNLGRTMSIIYELIFETTTTVAVDGQEKKMEWLQQMHDDQLFREQQCMKYKISPAEFDELLVAFVGQKLSLGKFDHKTFQELRSNFSFWIPKNKNANHATTTGKTRNHQNLISTEQAYSTFERLKDKYTGV